LNCFHVFGLYLQTIVQMGLSWQALGIDVVVCFVNSRTAGDDPCDRGPKVPLVRSLRLGAPFCSYRRRMHPLLVSTGGYGTDKRTNGNGYGGQIRRLASGQHQEARC